VRAPQTRSRRALPRPRAGGREPVLDNRFVLLEPLGEGGHAIVWRARDRLMRTMVAVKILRALDPDWQRRFALEAEVLANLHHVNVIRAIGRGRTPEGQPYVVLELVEGQSLRARLDGGGPLPWREVIEIGIQAAAALTALHSRGVIHRDVKPGNLMRTIDDGGGLVIKLIDFGVARLNSDWDELPGATPATPRRQTDAGMAIGTPAYMPMEAGLVPPRRALRRAQPRGHPSTSCAPARSLASSRCGRSARSIPSATHRPTSPSSSPPRWRSSPAIARRPPPSSVVRWRRSALRTPSIGHHRCSTAATSSSP
jgi:serine/threonine protein kinase